MYFTIQYWVVKNGRLIYTSVGIMGGYQGTLAGMWRIRSSCIWVSQKYPCATEFSAGPPFALGRGAFQIGQDYIGEGLPRNTLGQLDQRICG